VIRALLAHHIARLDAGAEYNALQDCHVVGLHSIVLHDEEGNRIRLFYADRTHALHLNDLPHGKSMSLAIHAHRFATMLSQVFGNVRNDTFVLEACDKGNYEECFYERAIQVPEAGDYHSGVKRNASGLTPSGKCFIAVDQSSRWLTPGGDLMPASTLHSIFVPEGERAAWIVMEGAVDADYRSVCYTRNPKFDPRPLYRPMHRDTVRHILTDCYHKRIGE
jgi:hypothetical protein